ncbi:hypothetical protein MtrunA17_Chr6g0450041 [Medicago truncatula]|uniref:Transmembrane protein, putative n=1 Tax=Medicago truncatula TaxID=3880 RepID=G7KHK4_MEDTR|nr:transmembrane protein, putative [Medicago truncatula]RHN49761.1 hypothetical protein MtrunA17_Chr6g0450041 [Medicago truncatula]
MAERRCSSDPAPVEHRRPQPHNRPQAPPSHHVFHSIPLLSSNYEDTFFKTFLQNFYAYLTFVICFIGIGNYFLDAGIQRNHRIAFYMFTLTIHSLFVSFLVSSFEKEVLLSDIMKTKTKMTLAFCIAISTSSLFYGSIGTGVIGILIWTLCFNAGRELWYLYFLRHVIKAFLYVITTILDIIRMIVLMPYEIVLGIILIYEILTTETDTVEDVNVDDINNHGDPNVEDLARPLLEE